MEIKIYADHAATTALSHAAYEAMLPWLQSKYGNPSTPYSLARDPRRAVAHSREVIATAINADPSEISMSCMRRKRTSIIASPPMNNCIG